MGFFMIIIFLVLCASMAFTAIHFVQKGREIRDHHALEIEREKTRQLELSSKIVNDFDPEKVVERLKNRPDQDEIGLYRQIQEEVEKRIREMFAMPNRIQVGERFPRVRPTIYQEALTEEEMEIYRHYFEDEI